MHRLLQVIDGKGWCLGVVWLAKVVVEQNSEEETTLTTAE